MGFFDVDFEKKVWHGLPVRLRQDAQYGWLKALIKPVLVLFGLFTANRAKNVYDLSINGQVCRLEKVLNDTFDNTLRRIYIGDPVYIDPVYLYRTDELKPVWLYLTSETTPVYMHLTSEHYSGDGVQFIVNVPAAITLSAGVLARMRRLVNKNRLPSKRNYTIVNF